MSTALSVEGKVRKHEVAIYTAAYAAGAAGVPGAFVPVLDVGAIGTIWATMLLAIASNAGRSLDRNTALKFATAVLAGGTAYLAGSKLAVAALNLIPGAGSIAAVGINTLLNFLYTLRLGRFAALQMEKSDFDTGDFADIIPEITNMVFQMPSRGEIRGTWSDMRSHQQYKN